MKSKVHFNSSVRHHAIGHIHFWTSITSTHMYNFIAQESIDFYEKLGKFISNTFQ